MLNPCKKLVRRESHLHVLNGKIWSFGEFGDFYKVTRPKNGKFGTWSGNKLIKNTSSDVYSVLEGAGAPTLQVLPESTCPAGAQGGGGQWCSGAWAWGATPGVGGYAWA